MSGHIAVPYVASPSESRGPSPDTLSPSHHAQRRSALFSTRRSWSAKMEYNKVRFILHELFIFMVLLHNELYQSKYLVLILLVHLNKKVTEYKIFWKPLILVSQGRTVCPVQSWFWFSRDSLPFSGPSNTAVGSNSMVLMLLLLFFQWERNWVTDGSLWILQES